MEATYQNQLAEARKVARERGLEALNNPHAMTGRICGCRNCFCCAALEVYNELRKAKSKTHGPMLHDYATGVAIREATKKESKASQEAAERDGGSGVILVDGRSCYVQE